MRKTGKWLERLMHSLERGLISDLKASVTSNVLKYGKNSQIAEFDLVIRGTLGSNPVSVLVECRDRKRKADSQWIELLIGRKLVHGFSTVCAVSTSGFTKGAIELASRFGIETKTVSEITEITSACVFSLLEKSPLTFIMMLPAPPGVGWEASIILEASLPESQKAEAKEMLAATPPHTAIIRVLPDDRLDTVVDVFNNFEIPLPPDLDPNFEGALKFQKAKFAMRPQDGQQWFFEAGGRRWPMVALHFDAEPVWARKFVRGVAHLIEGPDGKVAEVISYPNPFIPNVETSFFAIPQENGSSVLSVAFNKIAET